MAQPACPRTATRNEDTPTLILPRLYAIIDIDLCAARGTDPQFVAEACLAGGARLLQVRQKAPGSGSWLRIARHVVRRGREQGARVLLNDRADLALMSGADGVHLGQHDLPVAAVRALVGPDAVVGLSTHSVEQVDDAVRQAVDYLAVGPIYPTTTKDTGYGARGLELVRYAAAAGKPVVAIGGITPENARAVLAAGADSVAVISYLLTGSGPADRVREFLERPTA